MDWSTEMNKGLREPPGRKQRQSMAAGVEPGERVQGAHAKSLTCLSNRFIELSGSNEGKPIHGTSKAQFG